MADKRWEILGAYLGTKYGDTAIGKVANTISAFSNIKNNIESAIDMASNIFNGSATDLTKFLTKASGTYSLSSILDASKTSQRGSNYATTKGVVTGISTSASLGIGTDIGVNPSLDSQATASASAGSTTSSEELVTATQDLYNALFKEKLAVRVIVANLETAALNALTGETYKVSDEVTQSKLDLMRLNFSI